MTSDKAEHMQGVAVTKMNKPGSLLSSGLRWRMHPVCWVRLALRPVNNEPIACNRSHQHASA